VRRPLTALAACLVAVTVMTGCTAAGAKSLPIGSGTVPHLAAGQQATVTYCNGEKAHITEPPQLHGPAPTAVYVHGGSWVSGDFDTGGFIINKIGPALNAFGFVVVSVDYRLGPNKPWPAQIEDVKCAIRYLRANAKALHVDPTKIGAWGHSAGGHLVDLLGLAGPSVGWDVGAFTNQSSKVEAVIDLAGPTDLPTMGTFGAAGVVQDSFISLLGAVPLNKLGAALTAASPVTYVEPGAPPFLIFHSNNDPIVSYKQSQDLAWDLSSAGDSVQLVTVNGGGHLFTQKGASPTPAQITDQVVQFFVTELHARP